MSAAAEDAPSTDDQFVSIEDSLKHDIVGQPRTKKHYTFLRGAHVYKGPIDGKRLETMQTRPGWLAYWATPLVVLPTEFVVCADGTFLKFPNLCVDDNELTSEPYTERTTGITYQVLVRNGLVKMRSIFENVALRDATYAEFGRDLLLAFTHLYILGGGDLGPQNVLARLSADGARVTALHVIDLEDSRMAELDAPEFFLSKRQPESYGFARLLPYYAETARHVATLLDNEANEPHRPRIELAIQNLRRFAPVRVQKRQLAAPVNDDEAPTHKLARAAAATMASMAATTATATTTTTTTTSSDALALAPKRASLAIFHGMRGGGKTYSGIAFDVAKSALQKYVRRGERNKALVMAFELWRMAELEGARPVQSNLYNRLAVIAAEDIGPAQLDLCVAVTEYVCGWGATGGGGAHGLPPDRSAPWLAAIVSRIVASPKTRVMSHLWRAYTTEEGMRLARERGLRIDTEASAEDRAAVRGECARFFESEDPADLVLMATAFYRRLRARDHNAVYWAGRFVEAAKGRKAARRNNRTVAGSLLWHILERFLDRATLAPLATAFYEMSEPRPFLMAPITFILFSAPSSGATTMTTAATTTTTTTTTTMLALPKPFVSAKAQHSTAEMSRLRAEAAECVRRPMLTQLREGRYAVPVVDDYAIDKHTSEGRNKGMSRQEFVREGARVENEDAHYSNALLRSIYEDS